CSAVGGFGSSGSSRGTTPLGRLRPGPRSAAEGCCLAAVAASTASGRCTSAKRTRRGAWGCTGNHRQWNLTGAAWQRSPAPPSPQPLRPPASTGPLLGGLHQSRADLYELRPRLVVRVPLVVRQRLHVHVVGLSAPVEVLAGRDAPRELGTHAERVP